MRYLAWSPPRAPCSFLFCGKLGPQLMGQTVATPEVNVLLRGFWKVASSAGQPRRRYRAPSRPSWRESTAAALRIYRGAQGCAGCAMSEARSADRTASAHASSLISGGFGQPAGFSQPPGAEAPEPVAESGYPAAAPLVSRRGAFLSGWRRMSDDGVDVLDHRIGHSSARARWCGTTGCQRRRGATHR